jgi:hypothetical protein
LQPTAKSGSIHKVSILSRNRLRTYGITASSATCEFQGITEQRIRELQSRPCAGNIGLSAFRIPDTRCRSERAQNGCSHNASEFTSSCNFGRFAFRHAKFSSCMGCSEAFIRRYVRAGAPAMAQLVTCIFVIIHTSDKL